MKCCTADGNDVDVLTRILEAFITCWNCIKAFQMAAHRRSIEDENAIGCMKPLSMNSRI